MATRNSDGFDDADIPYAATMFAGHQLCRECVFAGGEEILGTWHSMFIFRLDDGQYGAVHGEEDVGRTVTNWTSFVHPSIEYIKEHYFPTHGKTWSRVSQHKAKEHAATVDAADIKSIRMYAEEVGKLPSNAEIKAIKDTSLDDVMSAAKALAEDLLP